MPELTIVTESPCSTVKRTYIVTSDTEPTDLDDLSGGCIIDVDSDDYDNEEIVSVERSE